MNVVSTLPSKPLNRTERNRLRAHEEVEALIILGTTSIDERHEERAENATSMVILTNETVYALKYEESKWSTEVLQRNADRRDHLEQALNQLEA